MTTNRRRITSVTTILFQAACLFVASGIMVGAQMKSATATGALEATSQLGRKLYALPDDAAVEAARAKLSSKPDDVSLVLALSKAQAARRQYREAVATCTKGLAAAPSNADLFIERGHRELGLRRFRPAMIDLEHAVSLDPKNLDAPYHLALSHYFVGEFAEAAEYFEKALALAQTPDSIIDCSNWAFVSLRRAGKEAEAQRVLARITPDMKNTEPHLRFYLNLLHFYQGGLSEQAVLPPTPAQGAEAETELAFDTTAYGVGNWHVYHGQPAQGKPLFEQVVRGEVWNSWGFIGSEVELVRMKSSKSDAPK